MAVRIVGDLACTEHMTDGRMRFVRPYVIEFEWQVGLARVKVPSGKISDGSSIPGWLRSIFPEDRTRQAGFVHDELYDNPVIHYQRSEAWDSTVGAETIMLSKAACDRIWGTVANSGDRRATLPRPLCWLGVAALFTFGILAWRVHRLRDSAISPLHVDTP